MELRVTAMARNGAGVARGPDGQVVFVDDALPGEVVTAEVHHIDKRWSQARVVAVLEPADDRVPVKCVHRLEGCGGCDMLHVAPDAQLRVKADVVREQLSRLDVAAPRPGFRPLVEDRGRTTARAAVVDGRAGYRRERSHDVIEIDDCGAVDPAVEELLVEGRFGAAAEVTVRVGARTGDRMVIVDGSADGIVVPDDVRVVSHQELDAGRRAWIHEEAAGRRWRISARSFFQNRPAGTDALVTEVDAMVGELGEEGPLVDAYGGVGLFAGTVGRGRRPTVIERSPDAVADARVNLADDDARILRLSVERWRASPTSVVVADPARAGLGTVGSKAIMRAEPSLVVLVSCDPSSFAADARRLVDAGMVLDRWSVVDLFPGTSHIETVGAFRAG